MVGSGPHQAGSHLPELARFQQQGNFPNPERDRNEENERFEREVCTPLKLAKATLVWVVMCSRDKITTEPCARVLFFYT